MKSERILEKILTLNFEKDFRSGEAEKRRRAFPPPPNFVFRFAKCAAKRKDVALAPALPCAGNDKGLPIICILLDFNFSIRYTLNNGLTYL